MAQSAVSNLEGPAVSESPRPWYLRAFVVVCAWFTALFFLVWIGILFNHSEEGMAFLGVLLLVGSSLIGRVVKDSDFLDHANLACALAGRVMVFMGFPGSFDDLATKAGVMTLAEPLWFALNPNSTYRFISACSAYLFMGLWLDEIEGGAQTWLPLVVAGALVPFVFALRPKWGGDRWDGVWRPLGWASVLVLSLWSVVGGDWLVAGKSPLDVYAASGMLTLLLLCLVGWLLKDRLGDALVVLPVLIALAWAMKGNPSVLGGLLLGLVGFRSREHKITAMAAATLLAGVVSYYYRLNETLLTRFG